MAQTCAHSSGGSSGADETKAASLPPPTATRSKPAVLHAAAPAPPQHSM